MGKNEHPEFWKGFVTGLSSQGGAPRVGGVVPARMEVTATTGETEPLSPARLWAPRAALKPDAGFLLLRGPGKRLWQVNRKSPGLRQTIDLIGYVNPDGRRSDAEIRIMALAAMHNLIHRRVARSRVAYELAVSIASSLELEEHPAGWAARTAATLPLQSKLPDDQGAEEDLAALGRRAGSDVAQALSGFLPVSLTFIPVKHKLPLSMKDAAEGLASFLAPGATSGRMSWRLMTAGAMSAMVWQNSLVEIAEKFSVSEARVRAYCRKNKVDMPSAGFWRMSEDRREAILRSLGHHRHE